MKKQFPFDSMIRWFGTCAFASCLLANGVSRAQETTFAIAVAGPGTNAEFRTGSGAGVSFFINGSSIGTILLKTCDLDQDGKVTPAEFKNVAAASFKLWDTNGDNYVSQTELSAAFKEFFPAPPPGAVRGMRMVNGATSEVSFDDLPTPDVVVSKHLLAAVDTNKDGLLSLQEFNDFIDRNFGQWDKNGDGSLDAEEFSAAFGQMALPDGALSAPAH